MQRLQRFFAWEEEGVSRRWAIGIIAAWIVILLTAGLFSSAPMLGDEYHHYAFASIYAEHHGPVWVHTILTSSGETQHRFGFSHPYLWGELLGWIFVLIGGPSFAVAQIYHVFWAILLAVSIYLLARTSDKENPAAAGVWALILLLSVPMITLFMITFYVDMPFAALNACCVLLLARRRYIMGSTVAGLALLTKLFAFFSLPAYALIIAWNERRRPLRILGWWAAMAAIILVVHIPTIIQRRDSPYPYMAVGGTKEVIYSAMPGFLRAGSAVRQAAEAVREPATRARFCYPGDLRLLSNWPRYLGVLLLPCLAWLILRRCIRKESIPLLLAIGIYVVCFIRMLWYAPDARYLSAVVVLLPALAAPVLGRRSVFVKVGAVLLAIATAISVGYVVRNARHDSPERKELRQFLVAHTNPEEMGLMYPEGDRLTWPRRSVWYLPGKDTEIVMTTTSDSEVARVLRQDGVDYVVVKKHLIRNRSFAPASGYTTSFVNLLRESPKFNHVFENRGFSVYRVPCAAATKTDNDPGCSQTPATEPQD